jgi:hypothetical protein
VIHSRSPEHFIPERLQLYRQAMGRLPAGQSGRALDSRDSNATSGFLLIPANIY